MQMLKELAKTNFDNSPIGICDRPPTIKKVKVVQNWTITESAKKLPHSVKDKVCRVDLVLVCWTGDMEDTGSRRIATLGDCVISVSKEVTHDWMLQTYST